MYYPCIAAGFLRNVARLVAPVAVAIILYPTSIFASLAAPSATPNSVTLTWTAPGDDGSQGTAATYDVRYSTSTITEANWNAATQATNEPVPQIAGTTETFTIDGLNASTTYYFAIKTADEIPNWSPISNVVNVSTSPEDVNPGNVVDLNAVVRFRYSILLGWTAPGDDGSSGTASVYDLRYYTSAITEANWDSTVQVANEPSPSVAGTVETLTVAGLNENTAYFFALKTADEVPNWSGLSNVVSTSTSEDAEAPSAINDLQASSGTDNGEIDLVWTAPGDDGLIGTAALYEIRFASSVITQLNWDSASLCSEPPAPLVCGNEQILTLRDLDAGEMYYVGIRAYDDAGNMADLSNVDSAVAKFSLISGIDDEEGNLPDHFGLAQNYPNPFNPTTEIRFSLPKACHVNLEIYNAVGQRVTTLVDGSTPAGEHSLTWDGTGSGHQSVATGVYFYRLVAEDFVDSKKMVLLK